MNYDREVLVDILLHHRPTESSACQCGGVPLGHSWPEHIADVYENTIEGKERLESIPHWHSRGAPGLVHDTYEHSHRRGDIPHGHHGSRYGGVLDA